MTYVVCVESEGLRDSEATVGVLDLDGRRRYLRVEKHFLDRGDGRSYLPVGVVYRDLEGRKALIEFPHEADSGENRVWVDLADLKESRA